MLSLMSAFLWILAMSEASPQRLEIDRIGNTYRFTDYRRIMGMKRWGATVLRWPFVMERSAGVLDQDFRGVGISTRQVNSNTIYVVGLQWKATSMPLVGVKRPSDVPPPITIATVSDQQSARGVMLEMAEKLGLPAVGRIVTE